MVGWLLGQETVVLDDFKDYAMPLVELQRLLDWYPLWVEVKGGSVPMLAKRYVLTANTSPEDWYQGRCPPHDMAPCDRLCGQARPPDPLCGRLTPPTPGAAGLRFLVILSPKARNLSPP